MGNAGEELEGKGRAVEVTQGRTAELTDFSCKAAGDTLPSSALKGKGGKSSFKLFPLKRNLNKSTLLQLTGVAISGTNPTLA